MADSLTGRVGAVEKHVGAITDQITALNAYRKSLIHECVTGKRRITEVDVNRVEAHSDTLQS